MTREEIEDELSKAPQYHFDRDLFCSVFKEVFGDDFREYDLFYDVNYESFDLWYSEDTWYIYSKQFDVAICWYKHLGRINQCTNEYLELIGLKFFFILLKEEYDRALNKE